MTDAVVLWLLDADGVVEWLKEKLLDAVECTLEGFVEWLPLVEALDLIRLDLLLEADEWLLEADVFKELVLVWLLFGEVFEKPDECVLD